MTRGRRAMWLAVVIAVALPWRAAAQQSAAGGRQLPDGEARDRNMKAYVELMRSDVRSEKVALITEMMHFTEKEDAAFWPIYREYELALSKLVDERLRGIEAYSKVYMKLTDATADELMTKALDLEQRRAALKQQYFTRLKNAISPLTAARALQVENQIQLLIDLQVAASLPVVD